MMKTKRMLLVLASVSLLNMAHAQTNAFVGWWTNHDPKGGITRLVISRDEQAWRIQAWGKCEPADCDFGRVEFKFLGDSPADNSPKFGFAHWDHRFKDTYLTLRLDEGSLVADTFDCFKDQSGRSDYHSSYLLKQNNSNSLAAVSLPAKSTRTFLEVVAVDPPTNVTLKAGEKATVRVRYQSATPGKVRIWVQPYTEGAYTPDGFYAPSAPESNGPGEVQRFVGVNGTALVDELQVLMVDAESKKQLARISHAVELKWEGPVPKPETIAPVGEPFPSLKFTSLQGQDYDLAKMKGKVVMVDFWATWCGPCRKEIPNLVAAYEKYHGDGFEIVGISLDKSKEALQSYIKDNKMPWPQYFDGKEWKNKIGQQFAVQAIPFSYLIDRQGVVKFVNLRGQQLTDAVARLLK